MNILFWFKCNNIWKNPWRVSQMRLTQRHLDIMGLLYSHQPASPTAAKQSDILKLWETWTEKDNFAHILHKLHCNLCTHNTATGKKKKKKIFCHSDSVLSNCIKHQSSSWTEIKTGPAPETVNVDRINLHIRSAWELHQFKQAARSLRQKSAQIQFHSHFSTNHTF